MEKLFVDYDGTTVNTIKAICEMYEDEFWAQPGYHHVDWSEIESWEFNELDLASAEHIDNYFNKTEFFKRVEFMPWADYILEMLQHYFDIYIISMGSAQNLALKEEWCKEHIPFAKFIGADFADHKDKSSFDMRNGILIDDVYENLNTCNAQKRICFGDKYVWNTDWRGDRCASWIDVWKKIGQPRWFAKQMKK